MKWTIGKKLDAMCVGLVVIPLLLIGGFRHPHLLPGSGKRRERAVEPVKPASIAKRFWQVSLKRPVFRTARITDAPEEQLPKQMDAVLRPTTKSWKLFAGVLFIVDSDFWLH